MNLSFPLIDIYVIIKLHHILFLLLKNIISPLKLFKLSVIIIQDGVFLLCFLSDLIKGSDILVCYLSDVLARVSLDWFWDWDEGGAGGFGLPAMHSKHSIWLWDFQCKPAEHFSSGILRKWDEVSEIVDFRKALRRGS